MKVKTYRLIAWNFRVLLFLCIRELRSEIPLCIINYVTCQKMIKYNSLVFGLLKVCRTIFRQLHLRRGVQFDHPSTC